MNPFNLNRELHKIKTGDTAVSPLVRTRLDDTYAAIREQSASSTGPAADTASPPRSRLRRYLVVPAACGVLGITLFASGFVSPVMASSIKSVPLLGSLFSAIESDIGLRNAGTAGLTAEVNSAVSHNEVTFHVKETVYDGSRAAFVVQVSAPNLENGMYDNGKDKVKLSSAVDNVWFNVKGQSPDNSNSPSGDLFYGGTGEDYPDTLVFEQIIPAGALPDTFEAEVTFELQGIDHEFKLNVPFKLTTDQLIEAAPALTVSTEEFTATIDRIQMTPVTTRLNASVMLNGAEKLTEKQEKRLRQIGLALFDDQGRQLPVLNGEGEYHGNRLEREYRYATTAGNTAYVVVKPFVIKDDFAQVPQDSQFIEELAMKIDLTAGAGQK